MQEVRKIEERLEKVEKLVQWVNKEEALFKFPITAFPQLEELKVVKVFKSIFLLNVKFLLRKS